jgi:glycosyltransferase involved in cell wall biosynthesis
MLSVTPPPIAPFDQPPARPRFSVMLPTHEPDGMLVQALESVLEQAPAAGEMQIAVVDDGSRPGRVTELVAGVDPRGRVEVYEHRDRLGLCGNWNRAIALARGELVHLLHQDDYVLPGFYERMDHGFRRAADCGMAFCRTRLVDAEDRLLRTVSRQQWLPGLLANWLPRIAERQRIQTPSVVVARRTYEAVGGYRPDLQLALDWEMWVRIAAAYPVWYEPRPLASYRRHAANETARLMASGAAWPDMARAIEINARSLPPDIRDRTMAASVRWYAASAMRTAERQITAGAFGRAAVTLGHVPEMLALLDDEPRSLTVFRRLANLRQQVGHGLNRRAA